MLQVITDYPINLKSFLQKNLKKKLMVITVHQKRGGSERYDHDQRFNGFFSLPKKSPRSTKNNQEPPIASENNQEL